MTSWRLTVAMLIAGVLVCCSRCAHAQGAADSLAALCHKQSAIAPLVEAAAAKWRVRPVVLVAMARVESSCGDNPRNRVTGALGVLQVIPGRSADPDHLEAAELLDPATSIELGARHLRKCVDLCGSLAGGLHVFHGGKRCREWRGDGYVAKVLSLVEWAKRRIRKMQARRS